MKTQVAYTFPDQQVTYRFLNELKHWQKADVDAKLFKGSNSVKVSYIFDGNGFDTTCSLLDDLASQYSGQEISI